MPSETPVLSEWTESHRLAGRNFCCQRCGQRWNEAELRWQDGFYICAQNCYEENGGEIDRTLERAEGAKLAAELDAKEQRPPKQAGWSDESSITVISAFSIRPCVAVQGTTATTQVLTGVGFSSTDTITSDAGITITPVVDSTTQETLTITASTSATLGLHSITHNSDIYRDSIKVT